MREEQARDRQSSKYALQNTTFQTRERVKGGESEQANGAVHDNATGGRAGGRAGFFGRGGHPARGTPRPPGDPLMVNTSALTNKNPTRGRAHRVIKDGTESSHQSLPTMSAAGKGRLI
jgi:hypothetical protein